MPITKKIERTNRKFLVKQMRMTVSLCGFDSKFVKFDIIDAYKWAEKSKGVVRRRLGEERRG